jgi:hypothetical protein
MVASPSNMGSPHRRTDMHRILFGVVVLAVLLTPVSKAQEVGDYPDDIRRLSFSQTLLSSGYDGPFAKVVAKRNIVWIRDEIDVNKAIRSYGGTVIIVANTVRINQPIDSRVYFQHDVDHFLPDPDKSHVSLSVEDEISESGPYKNAFSDYYLHCSDCIKDSKGHTYMPEFPSGLTPTTEGFFKNLPGRVFPAGTNSPDDKLDPVSGTSGDIYIFAHEIIVSKDLGSPHLPEERAECHQKSPDFVPYAVNAGGAQGGRGGAGISSPCVKAHVSGMFSCAQEAYLIGGGLNAAGGSGGNSGNVLIRLINYDDGISGITDLLQKVTNIAGGIPGAHLKVRTPSAQGTHLPDGTRCSFTEESPTWPPAGSGKPGRLEVKKLDTNTALSEVASLLNELDSRNDYDYRELAERAKTDRSIYSLHLSDELTHYLATSLVKAETLFVTDADRRFYLGTQLPDGYLSPFFATINSSKLDNSELTDRQLIFARELNTFKQIPGADPFPHYLQQSGGALNIYSNGAFARYTAQATRIDINTGNQLLGQVEVKLDGIHRVLFEQFAHERAVEYENKVSALKTAIAQAKKKAADAANSGGPLQFIGAVVSALDGGAGGITAVVNALITKFNSDNPLEGGDAGLGQGLANVSDSFRKLQDLARSAPNDPTIQDLMNELTNLLTEYATFKQSIEDDRERLLREQYRDFLDVLDSRYTTENKLESDSAQFHDLLRTVIAGYLVDPARDDEGFRNNLQSLITFLNKFPVEEPYFRPIDVNKLCDSPNNNCFQVQPSKQWVTIYGYVPIGTKPLELPLYVVAPHRALVLLPSFGVKISRTVKSNEPPRGSSRRLVATETIFSPLGWEFHPKR